MTDATPPGQISTATTIKVYHTWTGPKQRQLRQVPGFEHP
jgi:hypothetical protein